MIAELMLLTLLLGIDLGMLVYHIGLDWRRRKIEADLAEQAEAFRRRTWQPAEWINVGTEVTRK